MGAENPYAAPRGELPPRLAAAPDERDWRRFAVVRLRFSILILYVATAVPLVLSLLGRSRWRRISWIFEMLMWFAGLQIVLPLVLLLTALPLVNLAAGASHKLLGAGTARDQWRQATYRGLRWLPWGTLAAALIAGGYMLLMIAGPGRYLRLEYLVVLLICLGILTITPVLTNWQTLARTANRNQKQTPEDSG